MNSMPICPRCLAPVPPGVLNAPAPQPCAHCGTALQAWIFPALFRPAGAPHGAAAPEMPPGEASCFHHPQRGAVRACESCGRFLCDLCVVSIGQRHVCAACLHREHTEAHGFRPQMIQYDMLAISLALLPFLIPIFWFMSLITAPAALFLVIRFWKKPMSLLPRWKFRLWLGGLVALGVTAGWVALFVYLILKIMKEL